MRNCSWVPGVFENLAATGFDIVADCTSDRTRGRPSGYNCIAWAAGRTGEWWWPCGIGGYTWPVAEGTHIEPPNKETLDNFIAAFRSIGYLSSDNGNWEDGFEKVALYVNNQGIPTHAARSLPDGNWTSKLGEAEDIRHPTPESIGGRVYGKPVAFLKREIPGHKRKRYR